MQNADAAWLQTIEAFKDVPVDQLQWFIDNSRQYGLKEGEFLFREGMPITGTFIVIEGRIKLYRLQGKEALELTVMEAREITGHLPYSRGVIAIAYGIALQDSTVIFFPIERSKEMITRHFELTQALVHIMITRVRDFTTLQQQNEKLMALGKLSAGLAHELNNPASAIVRGSISLKKHLQLVPASFKDVISIRMSATEVDIVNNKMFEVLGRKEKPVLTMMQRTAKEDELSDWMQEYKIANLYEIAENFADTGFTLDDLEEFKSHIPQQYLSPIFNWINTNLVTEKMVADIQDASERISDLVSSVKEFTHMDQGHGRELTDIHSGIKSTLTMLNHKIKKGNIQIVEEFDHSLPALQGYPSALNQVWTNLFDNALDAMEGTANGRLTIKTEKNREFIKVTISDNGPGIPENIRSRIFEPFFTTKPIGKGTGLGLDAVMRIIHQHNGSIKVDSIPGNTAFIACFPIDN